MSDDSELIAIGKVERPFGVRGQVRVRSLSDVPGRFEGLQRVALVTTDGDMSDVSVKAVRKVHGAYILDLEGIGSPEEAARYRGGYLKIPRQLAPPLPQHQFYEFELLGAAVVDQSGTALGVIDDIVETAANHVLVVRGQNGEHLLPATKEVVRSVDLEARRVTVDWSAALVESGDAL